MTRTITRTFTAQAVGSCVVATLLACTANTHGASNGGQSATSSSTSDSSNGEASETATASSTLLPTTTSAASTGDATVPPAAAELRLAFSPIKQFDFRWTAAVGAEFYQLFQQLPEDQEYLRLGGDILGEAVSMTMPLHLRHGASYVLRSCNTVGCADSGPLTVTDSMVEAIGYFKAVNTGAHDAFGSSIALSSDGTTLAVGAPGEDSASEGIDQDAWNNGASDSGAVYVYALVNGAWTQHAYIKASNTDAGDYFGYSISLSDDGNTLAVGAHSEDGPAVGVNAVDQSNDSPNAGAVYVFTREVDSWSQAAYVKASNTGAGDGFGVSVALAGDGNTLAVGASGEDSAGFGPDADPSNEDAVQAGAVYVFTRTEGKWLPQSYIKASNTGAGDEFGCVVALSYSGDFLAVGASEEDSDVGEINGDQSDNSAVSAGAAYMFTRKDGGWSQDAYIKASNSDPGDRFGRALALSADGRTLAVGALGERSAATGLNDGENSNDLERAGAAYVFYREGSTWGQQAYAKSMNTGSVHDFGRSMAISANGDIIAVGAMGENGSASGVGGPPDSGSMLTGAIYIYSRTGQGTWSPRAYVKASNPDMEDQFGERVALSSDGLTLAVSAKYEDSAAFKIGDSQNNNNAANSGAVYLY